MSLPAINQEYFTDFLVKLLNITSPTGFAEPAIAFVEKEIAQYKPLELSRTRRGALVAKWKVESDLHPVALTAHVDTLGAVVKEIKPSGRLKLSRIGGIQWPTVETEGVWIYTSKGEKIRGSVLIDTASGHIYSGTGKETLRNDEHMEVRLDARTTSEKETRALGINVGDCIAFDPRVEVTNGFIRSRFLDDKACVVNILAAIKSMAEAGLSPARSVYFHISNYEEVGHGASAGIPSDVAEVVTVDMACTGGGAEKRGFCATVWAEKSGATEQFSLKKKKLYVRGKKNISNKNR